MKHLSAALTLALAFLVASSLHAQVGNNNPGGVSGIFNGQVTTGCSYDPYTGNATRSITDIAVAGAVGQYPLALVRTANSRAPATTQVFSAWGGWNHNYNWILEDSPTSTTQNFQPARFTVDFPDGRVETFRAVTWDSYYRVRPGPDTPAQSTSAGVRERFIPLSGGYCYLVLPDGGKVKFHATQHQLQNGSYYYTYQAIAIIDPHGLQTTLTYETTGLKRLLTVTEPAGRYLQFSYISNGPRIDHVTASDGRTVQYTYGYSGARLDQVTYYNNPNWVARYQYVSANVGGPGTPQLLRTCDDPMYPGPMKRIAYEYKTGNNPDGTAAVYGQILRERYWDGVAGHETTGPVVSTLAVGTNGITNNPTFRMETRGDGAVRTFIYTVQGYLTWISGFMGHVANQTYDSYKSKGKGVRAYY